MKTARTEILGRPAEVSLEALLAVLPPRFASMHETLTGKGYVCSGGRLRRVKDGTWTARVVWRHREDGLSVVFSDHGLRMP